MLKRTLRDKHFYKLNKSHIYEISFLIKKNFLALLGALFTKKVWSIEKNLKEVAFFESLIFARTERRP